MADTTNEQEVSIPYSIAKSLVENKIRSLNKEIEKILIKWNQKDIEKFQEETKKGNIPEAETEAIIAGNLMKKLKELKEIRKTF
ncbi:MAG: hypothetical protein ACTSYA_05300 [Candidatus Kariarchaeaceae archaeon]